MLCLSVRSGVRSVFKVFTLSVHTFNAVVAICQHLDQMCASVPPPTRRVRDGSTRTNHQSFNRSNSVDARTVA